MTNMISKKERIKAHERPVTENEIAEVESTKSFQKRENYLELRRVIKVKVQKLLFRQYWVTKIDNCLERLTHVNRIYALAGLAQRITKIASWKSCDKCILLV